MEKNQVADIYSFIRGERVLENMPMPKQRFNKYDQQFRFNENMNVSELKKVRTKLAEALDTTINDGHIDSAIARVDQLIQLKEDNKVAVKETNRFEFVDAQAMHAKYPDTFYAPTKKELDSLKVGASVKVCTLGERFWVTVKKIDGDLVTGEIDNNLFNTALKLGDMISFSKNNIYDIYSGKSEKIEPTEEQTENTNEKKCTYAIYLCDECTIAVDKGGAPATFENELVAKKYVIENKIGKHSIIQIDMPLKEAEEKKEEQVKKADDHITDDMAKAIALKAGIDTGSIDLEQFKKGFAVEREHADVVGDNEVAIAKIVMAHLRELPDYYTRLTKMETGGKTADKKEKATENIANGSTKSVEKKQMKETVAQDDPDSPEELATSYINGNISYVKAKVQKDAKLLAMVVSSLNDIKPDAVARFLEVMSEAKVEESSSDKKYFKEFTGEEQHSISDPLVIWYMKDQGYTDKDKAEELALSYILANNERRTFDEWVEFAKSSMSKTNESSSDKLKISMLAVDWKENFTADEINQAGKEVGGEKILHDFNNNETDDKVMLIASKQLTNKQLEQLWSAGGIWLIDRVWSGSFDKILADAGKYRKEMEGDDTNESKTKVCKRASRKNVKEGYNNRGSSKLPNKYYVTGFGDFMVESKERTGGEGAVMNWASDEKFFGENWAPISKMYGEFNTYKEAKEAAKNVISTDISEVPQEKGINTIVIEDHLTGELMTAGINAYRVREPFRFEFEEYENTEFTKKELAKNGLVFEGESLKETSKTLYLSKEEADRDFPGWNEYPNFSRTGSIKGMRKNYYKDNAFLVGIGSYIYNLSGHPNAPKKDVTEIGESFIKECEKFKSADGVEYWAEPAGDPKKLAWHVVGQAEGHQATEAHDEWFANEEDAKEVAKKLAKGQNEKKERPITGNIPLENKQEK